MVSCELPVSLESVVITDELDRRPVRAAEFAAENTALLAVMRALKKEADGNVFQHLAQTALSLCCSHSAGVSIEEEGQDRRGIRWYGAAGRWSALLWQTVPRDACPCGVALDRKAPVLMAYPERHFVLPDWGLPPIVEALFVPFVVDGATVGTVWAIAHDCSRRFDREDVRLLTTLSECAALSYQMLQRNLPVHQALAMERRGSQLLQAISTELTREDDVNALYSQVLDAAKGIMGADFASLQMLEDGRLRLLAHSGLHPLTARYVEEETRPPWTHVMRAGVRLTTPDIEDCPELVGTKDLEELRRSGIRAVQATPLMSHTGRLVGVLSTKWRSPHQPTGRELGLLDVLARLAADLIDRASTHHALRELDRRKNEFLAVLSHELRNPLAPITTGLELLRRPECTPEQAGSIHAMMTRQVAHLTRLVNDLLDLSRITRGTVELRRAPIDLQVMIEAAVELIRPLIDQRRHELVVKHAGQPLIVEGDLDRLTQVLANVLSNAARYTDPQGRIHLCAGAQGSEAVIQVEDSGLGIPAGRLEAVFEMFTQVPEHGGRGGGLGIGLALSRRLAELHGGSIVAQSRGLGCGSEFVIRLPLAGGTPAAEVCPPAVMMPVLPRRLLIIEDNTDAATTLHAALESAGHTARIAHDGPAGLAMLEELMPEVVLLDIGLPGMDGYETARRIRENPHAGQILIIAVTGWGQESDRERARQAGVDVHLTKPITLDALQAALDKALEGPPRSGIGAHSGGAETSLPA